MTLPSFIANPDPSVYLTDDYIVVDFETTNDDKGSALSPKNDIVLACWKLGKGHPSHVPGVQHEWGTEYEQSRLLSLVREARVLVAHNAKFELQWLKRCGLDLRSVLPFCTQLAEYVYQGNRKVSLALDSTANRRGLGSKHNCVSSLIHAGVSPADIPRALLLPYCEQDVALAERVFLSQRAQLKRLGLIPVVYSRNLVTPVLADIEEKGMCLDSTRVLSTHSERVSRFGAACAEFEEFTGGINPRSAKQLREYLYGKLGFSEVEDARGSPVRTAAGKPATSRGIISQLDAGTPEQQQFKRLALDIAKLKKPVENLNKMIAVLEGGGNLVHAQFNQSVTQTHRLSSSGRKGGFQFHNFDREFKPLFKARNAGWHIVEADAAQLEFWAAAVLADDPQARQDIIDAADIHSFTASVFNISRQAAKAETFRPLYGATSGTPKQKKYYKAFREKYKAIYETQRAWTFEALKTGQVVTKWGLRFYFPDTKLKEGGYITNTTNIFNYPVQSFATAEIIPLTLVLVWHRMRDMEGFLVNTIHDSIIAEIPLKELDVYSGILVECFTQSVGQLVQALYGINLTIPLTVGIKQADHWGEGTEQKHRGSVLKKSA